SHEQTPAPAEAGTGVSSNVVALVRVPPKYPRRAANRRIQGWVKIEFTITRTGTVKDAVVVEAKPNGIFDRVALEAINKWKFKEKRVNGAPVEQRAVQVLQFKLAK
ncbi:MAG: energy transducer TonB, partial [Methylobacter sp.]|uniref:energy transducer TonB n=1 Tax=Methylobacter sp. TaxID=2051955 RepID=UPI00258BC5FD